MAGHNDGNGVRGASASDGANCFGLAERAGDLRIGARVASRYALQFLPHAALKCGGLQIERKLEVRRASLDALQYFLHPALEAVRGGGNFRTRIFIAQLREE